MQIGFDNTKLVIKQDQSLYRKKLGVLALISIFVFIFSLFIKQLEVGLISPTDIFANYKAWIQINVSNWMNTPTHLYKEQIIDSLTYYHGSIWRLKVTIISFTCGVLLAMSGAIFQTVFRNPIATPTMLGVNAGAGMGTLIFVLVYGGFASSMLKEKYIYSFVGAVMMFGIILITGKISSGKKKFSIFDLLIIAAILSLIFDAVESYILFEADNDFILLHRQVSDVMSVDINNEAFILLSVVTIISIIPIYLLRFTFNTLSFENDEAKSLGIDIGILKILVTFLGTVMITAAIVHCGLVAMMSLITPFISRAIFGADFRKMFWGNMIIGGTLMLVCRDIASIINFSVDGLPVGTVVSIAAMPIYVVIMVSQRRTWE